MPRKFDYDAAWAALETRSTIEVAREFGVSRGAIKRLHKLPRDENGRFMPAGKHRAHYNPNLEAVREAVEQHAFTTGGWSVPDWAAQANMSTGAVYRYLRKLGVSLPSPVRRGRTYSITTADATAALAAGKTARDIHAETNVSLSAVYAAFRRARAVAQVDA